MSGAVEAAAQAGSGGAAAGSLGPVVVKIGSSTLTTTESSIDYGYLASLADQVAAIKAQGYQPIIVTSAAIASGLERLGMAERPSDMPSLQAAASVGQSALSAAYAQAFEAHGITTSLVLLTRRDTADRSAYLHARDTLGRLLELGVVPVVNENDTVSVEQIRFGDNDTLAALVACLVHARLVVILSDVEGLFDANPVKDPDATLIPLVRAIDEGVLAVAGDAGTVVGSGGMVTKLRAARVLMAAGIPLVVCAGRRPHVDEDVVAGRPCGTRFEAEGPAHEITPRKLWIALGDAAQGAVVVDEGARCALVEQGRSLLCVGVSAVEGSFEAGDIVAVKDGAGLVIGRGRVAEASDELELACGLSREAFARNRILANLAEGPIIHRDELIVFE